MPLLEPAVSLTDLGLAIENAAFAALLARAQNGTSALRTWWVLFFSSLAFAAGLGFMSHGFFADKSSVLHQWVWTLTLLFIGVTAFAASAVAARLTLGDSTARQIMRGTALLLVLYGLVVMGGVRHFGIAIAAYAPAILFLLTAFVLRARRTPEKRWLLGIGGLAMSVLAAAVQLLGIGLHPVNFNHNALYHVIQAVALWLLYLSACHLPADRTYSRPAPPAIH